MTQLVLKNFDRHASLLPGLTMGMGVIHANGFSCIDSNLPCDTFNIIHITNGERLGEHELGMAFEHFRRKNFPFCIWISDEHLSDHVKSVFSGLSVSEKNEEPGMVLDLSRYRSVKSELYNNVRIVSSPRSLRLCGCNCFKLDTVRSKCITIL